MTKKLVLLFLLACTSVAFADGSAATPQEQACYDLANHDPAFAASIKKTIDANIDVETIKAHDDAFHHIQKNEAHVIYAYAAMWVIAAAFLLFVWRRQQGLRSEIAQLRSELAAAAKDSK